MSERACADIFYGIVLDESHDLPDEILSIDWGKIYLDRCGLSVPTNFLDAICQAKEESRCYIGRHGHHDEPEYYIATVLSHIHNDWDAPRQLEENLSFKHYPEMDTQLLEFCKVLGIPENMVKPKWYLVSSLR